MSLLDDLRQQAEDIQRNGKNTPEAQRERFYQSHLKPSLQDIHTYLLDLKTQLDIVEPDIRHGYDLPGVGRVENLRQRDYVVNVDSFEHIKTVRLRFVCIADKPEKFEIRSRTDADTVHDFFNSQRMQFAEWAIRDPRGKLIGANFEGRVKIENLFLFQADIEAGNIRMVTSNFDNVGVQRFVYRPEDITEGWLDNLGNLVLRKHHQLNSLEISDLEIESIRRLVEEEKQARQAELDNALQAERESMETKRAAQGLSGKIRRMIDRQASE